MSSSKSTDLSQLMNGWKEKTNKDIVKNRITRMASAYVSDSNKINKNPKNFIPELPLDIRNRFTQDESRSSDKSTHKSLNNIRNTTVNQKSFDDFDETLKSNNTRPITSKNIKANDSSLNSNKSTRTVFKDQTNNQAEKSRRDTFYLDKTDNVTSSIIEANNSRLTKTTLKANAFKQSYTKNKHLNSTAIASNSNKASNFPVTPILNKTTLTNQLVSFDEEFNDEIDDNFEQSVQFTKNKTSLKPHLSSTSNTSQLLTKNKSILKQKDSEQQCRKSLNFEDKSQAEHELRSKRSVKEHSKTEKEKSSENHNFNDKKEHISRSKSRKRSIIESDLEEEPIVIDEEKTITVDDSIRSKKMNKKANTFELVQHKESNKSTKSDEKSAEKASTELSNKTKTTNKSKSKIVESDRDSSPELSNKSKTINKSKNEASDRNSSTESSNKSKTINKSKTKNETSDRDSSPESSNRSKTINKSKSKIVESDRDRDSSTELSIKSKSKNGTIAIKQSDKISLKSKESKQLALDISSKQQSSNNISKQLSNKSRQLNDKTADILQNSPKNKSKTQSFNDKSVTMSRSIDEKSREQSINNLKQLLSTNKTNNKSIPKLIEPNSIRNDIEIVQDNSDDSFHDAEPIEEPVVEVEPQPTVSKSKITIQRIPAKPKPAVTPITTNQESDFVTPINTDPFDQVIDLNKNRRSKLVEKTPQTEISLNQTDSDLMAANSNIYLKKSFTRSINNITSSVNMSTSTSRKTTLELKQSLLSNKQSKSSFAVPSLPNHSKTKSDESRNSNHSSTRIENNKSSVVQNDLGFSNIEPADMFSPLKSISEPNDNLKANENPKTKEISSQSIAVKEKKNNKEATNLESENKTKKPLIKIKNTDNKENKKNRSPQKSRKSKSPPKQKTQKSKNAKSSQRVLKTPEKYTQTTINKNFLVTRKTICPLSPVEALEEDSGLRRSKRVKVDSSKLPIYEFQRIKDFSGEDVIVQTIVATTKRTCRLEDYLNEIERKKNHVNEKPKSRIIKPKRDLSDSSSDESQPETSRNNTSNKKPKRSNNEAEIDDSPPNTQTMEPIMLRTNESNLIEDSLVITQTQEDKLNLSRTSFLFESEDTESSMKHVFTFSNNMDSLVFEKVYEGVGIKAFSDSDGVLCIDPERCSKTQSHPGACIFFMQKGECYISLNGNITKIRDGDVFSIPENCLYKIKNTSSTNNAYCYFKFI